MRNNIIKHIFRENEYKILYKRILFTCLIIMIYITGSNIPLIHQIDIQRKDSSFYQIAVLNTGGDISSLNIFTLGLGPWLTSMIIFSLIAYRNIDKTARQTRSEKHYKEKLLTILLSLAQSCFLLNQYVSKEKIDSENIYILLLILVTGTMLLVWLADQNIRYGIAGPMPIVLVSIIKSLSQQNWLQLQTSILVIMLIICVIAVTLFVLLFMELIEYRTNYQDIMNFSNQDIKKYLAWKINPAGSISIMISISVFVLLSNLINMGVNVAVPNHQNNSFLLNFSHPIGITIYVLIQMFLGYFLSRFLLNTKNKTEEFLKNGNYFIGVKPGAATSIYLNKMARRICWFGSIMITTIIAIPLYSTLLVPELSQQIYFAIQLIVLVYIGINITETIRTYLYFDRYKQLLDKYW